jgi:hypothetical protein
MVIGVLHSVGFEIDLGLLSATLRGLGVIVGGHHGYSFVGGHSFSMNRTNAFAIAVVGGLPR